MKILVLNYSFNAASKQITFTDYNPIIAERVLLITNTTDGIIIYNFADPLKGGTCATNILTLTYDTTTMSNTDKLQIFYDDNATTMPVSGTVTANLSTTDNAVLDSIDGKTPALGQALAAAAVPVVLTAIQVTALTPPTAITGFATSAKQDTLLTELQLKADLTETQPVSLASVPTHGVTGTFYQATQPVSIAAMPSTPVTNADLATLASAVSATHMQVDVLSMPAGGSSLTDAELRATAVPVSVASIPSHAVTNAGTFAVQIPVITGIGHGVAVVTTAGTDVAIAASTACKKVTIQSQLDNTSSIAVGGSGVDATIATGTGIILNAGDAYEFEIDNLADVYIDSLVSGEGVRFCYYV